MLARVEQLWLFAVFHACSIISFSVEHLKNHILLLHKQRDNVITRVSDCVCLLVSSITQHKELLMDFCEILGSLVRGTIN